MPRVTYKFINGELVKQDYTNAPIHAGTYRAGDIPDMMADGERNKAAINKQFAAERKQEIINRVNQAYGD